MNRQKYTDEMYKLDSAGKIRSWSMELYETGDKVYQKTISGLEDGKKTQRVKEIKDSKVKEAWPRAVELMRNAVKKKKREGYTPIYEEALHAPTLTKPMKAQTYKPGKTKLGNRVWIQPKINGLRCTYSWDDDTLYTKSGIEFNLPEIKQFARTLSGCIDGATLDGEIFLPSTPVATIKSICHHPEHVRYLDLEYHIFDIITDEPQNVRLESLAEGFHDMWDELYSNGHMIIPVRLVHFEEISIVYKGLEPLNVEYERYLDQGHEGLMIRTYDGPYESDKRSKHILKWKPVFDEEFEVVHITYEHRMINGVQYKLVEFHCHDPESGQMFKAVPKWDVERRFQFYKDNLGKEDTEVINSLEPLTVEFRERTKNKVPFHAVAIDFRTPGY